MKKLITTLIFIFSFTTSPYLFANNMLTPEQIKNLTSLAIKGDSNAQLMLGIMYTNGYDVRQNYVTAKNWFGDACDNGLQEGCDEYKKPSLKGY